MDNHNSTDKKTEDETTNILLTVGTLIYCYVLYKIVKAIIGFVWTYG